jgi:glycogen operon protein
MSYPPVLWHIELSEKLDCKIIAEAWDAAGLYQIGYFGLPLGGVERHVSRWRPPIIKGDRGIVGRSRPAREAQTL